jgi:ferric-dicitrate binding protein FerR (iron transport regulator)
MSIVPDKLVDQWRSDYWRSDPHASLEDGVPESYIANRAAEWAIERLARSFDHKERRAYTQWKEAGQAYYEGFRDAMDEAASEARALLKGGESDGQ